MIEPHRGRLMFRTTGNGQQVVIGILHFPTWLRLTEGALYQLTFSGGRVSIAPDAIAPPLPDAEALGPYGIGDLLLRPIWPRSIAPGVMAVRLIAAFPDQSAWIVCGPAETSVLPRDITPHRGHAWCDVEDGSLRPIDAPIDAMGMGTSQPLTGHAIWPGPDGATYSLPVIETRWRSHFTRMTLMFAAVGRGEIAPAAARDLLRSDPQLAHIAPWGPLDEAYCAYLAALEDEAGADAFTIAPRDAASTQAHDERTGKIVARLMKAA